MTTVRCQQSTGRPGLLVGAGVGSVWLLTGSSAKVVAPVPIVLRVTWQATAAVVPSCPLVCLAQVVLVVLKIC